MLLAGYGAKVYKLETPDGGDIGRGWGPPFNDGEASFFLGLNPGKRSVSVNLKHPDGVRLVLRMIEQVDIVLENFRPGTLDRFGLGYKQASAGNPRLIYCSISGYGQNGPARDLSAMDLILQASSGLISCTGTEDGEQVRCGHSVADITAGMFALIGILIALHAREKSGQGQYVDVSMFDSMISAMASVFASYQGSGVLPRPRGTSFSTIVPYRTFPTKDREFALAVGSEKLWASFCQAIGHAELTNHPDYKTNALRVANRDVLEPMLSDIFRTDTAQHWCDKLTKFGVAAAPVRTLDEVLNDPQSAARQMFPRLDEAIGGFSTATGLPVKFSATPGSIHAAAPRLGQHTREILRELIGADPGEIEKLESAGIVRCAPATAATVS